MGVTQSQPTINNNKRLTSKDIEENINRVFSTNNNDYSATDTIGWNNTQFGGGKSYHEYGNDIRNVIDNMGNNSAINKILDEQTDDHAYVNDIVSNLTSNNVNFDLPTLQGGNTGVRNSDMDFFHLNNLPDSPLTEMVAHNDKETLRNIKASVAGSQNTNNFTPTSITPVSDINIGTFNGVDSALALSMRQPLSVNRF